MSESTATSEKSTPETPAENAPEAKAAEAKATEKAETAPAAKAPDAKAPEKAEPAAAEAKAPAAKPAEPAAAKPAEPAAAKAAEAAAPEAPVEAPFNPDILISCTSRFSRKAWDIFLKLKKEDVNLLKTTPLRATLTARTTEGAQEIHRILMKEQGVTEIKLNGKTITATATFADIQSVIKNPQSEHLDASLAKV